MQPCHSRHTEEAFLRRARRLGKYAGRLGTNLTKDGPLYPILSGSPTSALPRVTASTAFDA